MKKFAFLVSSFLTFSTLGAEAPWIIAVIDGPICPTPKLKNIISHQAPKTLPIACRHSTEFDRSIHGHFVVQEFLKTFSKKQTVIIHHYNVFDDRGNQDLTLWKKALDDIFVLKPQLTIMAMGHVNDLDRLPTQLPSISFVATGTVGWGIEKNTRLWPHELQDPQLILVGHFIPSRYGHLASHNNEMRGHLDSALLYTAKMRYVVAQPSKTYTLGGSSRAAAVAAAIAITQCGQWIKFKDIDKLHKCLHDMNPLFVEKDAPFYTVLQN